MGGKKTGKDEFIIDKLVLDIEVKDGNSKEDSSSKKVRSLATAISLLNKNIAGFDGGKMTRVFTKMGSSVKVFTGSLKGANKTIQAMATIMKSSNLKQVAETVTGKSVGTKSASTSTISGGSASDSVLGGSVEQGLGKVKEEVEKTDRAIKNTTTSLGKLLKSFTRIATYRAIRTILKEIASGLLDTFKAIAQVDPTFNSTMSNITSSIDMLKASLGVGLYQTLAVLEPLITGLTNIIVTFTNSMAKVGAVMKGQGNYLKINTQYLKDYASAMQGALLPFDEFTTLGGSGGIDYSKMFEEVETGGVESFTGFEKAFNDLGNAFKKVWDNFIKPVWEGIQKFFAWLNKNDALVGFLGAVLGLVLAIKAPFVLLAGAVMYFIGSFEKLGNTAKWLIPTLAGLLAVIAGIVAVSAGGGWGTALVAGVIAGGIALVAGTAMALATPKNYRFGGDYQSADMFYANENGRTEMVASNNSGGGSVMTMEMWGQISEASFYNALVAYDASQNGNNGGGININGLGKVIASSSGFTNEINRRNPNLSLV